MTLLYFFAPALLLRGDLTEGILSTYFRPRVLLDALLQLRDLIFQLLHLSRGEGNSCGHLTLTFASLSRTASNKRATKSTTAASLALDTFFWMLQSQAGILCGVFVKLVVLGGHENTSECTTARGKSGLVSHVLLHSFKAVSNLIQLLLGFLQLRTGNVSQLGLARTSFAKVLRALDQEKVQLF